MEHINTMAEQCESHLEPRVARLETGLETLTQNVSEMAVSIRENAGATNQKIDALVIAVTQAQAPKKTDWSLFVSIGFFILALGSAVFWPLNKYTQDNRSDIVTLTQKFDVHQALDMHPVGQAKINDMQKIADDRWETYLKQHDALDVKLQHENQLMQDVITTKVNDLDTRIQREFSALNTAMDLRVGHLEQYIVHQNFGDLDELREWRSKATGLSAPNMTVPLVPKEVQK